MNEPSQETPVETTVEKKNISFPGSEGIPQEVHDMIQKSMKANPSRSFVFENDKQRNIGILRKGLVKPGQISFEVLRRAIAAVPVARICVNVLKQKVSKTKWVIKSIDPLAKADEGKIKRVTEILKNPNDDDTWREFLDKLLEDLLVLDSVAIEKTRFENGELAQMYNVDASTIRPVYNEFGQQDVPIPLQTAEGTKDLPVSYLQIFNNSMYGGPESGEIVAAWAKKDMMYFHMYPQGSMENFGYGLSPLEAVISVVASLLNTDNYNSSYFDLGAFPPIILQLTDSLEQRQLEAYREYLYGELNGEFHRPAIMAGGGEMKVHNLKDLSNRDMQFMEYTEWLAKLMAGSYGLTPQDIGLTDDVNRSTSETMKNLSEAKGYGSVLNLLKEVINNNILYKDFGYTDLEFDWVNEDSQDPKTSSEIHDTALKNGTLTVNEVREKNGELPYGDWADQPLLLTSDGYIPIHFDDSREEESQEEYANETVYREDTEADATVEKTRKLGKLGNLKDKPPAVSKSVYTASGFKTYVDDRGFGQPFICVDIMSGQGWVIKPPVAVNLASQTLEENVTLAMSGLGLNVPVVKKMLFKDIVEMFGNADIALEFDKYITMTPEYDSEKWRARHGGSRKYPYYLVSSFVDGFPLTSRQIVDDMKRDPTSYTQAVLDLAALWKAEKDMVLGDRRADQYIITPDKRAHGFDYQFQGDLKRWEDTSTSIVKVLIQIPSLYKLFNATTADSTNKTIKKDYTGSVKNLFNRFIGKK